MCHVITLILTCHISCFLVCFIVCTLCFTFCWIMFVFYFVFLFLFFFFKQKTAYEMRISDWISDVCSSDLSSRAAIAAGHGSCQPTRRFDRRCGRNRSEARRVGKECGRTCRSRGSPLQ